MSDRWPTYEPSDDPAPPRPAPAPYDGRKRFRTYDPRAERRRLKRRVAAMVGRVGLVLGTVGVGAWAISDRVPWAGPHAPDGLSALARVAPLEQPVEQPVVEQPSKPAFDPFSDATTSAMITALRERTGSRQALEVTFFKDQIIVKVPGLTDDGPALMYIWDGELELYGETDVYRHPFNITPLRGSAVGALCGKDRQQCVAEVRRPYDSEEGHWMEVTDMETMHTRYGDLAGRTLN